MSSAPSFQIGENMADDKTSGKRRRRFICPEKWRGIKAPEE